jgi:succinate dehydrogenase / fumarate reductase flavoprotein subunit
MNLRVEDVKRTDVLVVGGGGAAITAAIAASKAGAKVLLVSKGQIGNSGNTIMIGGSFAMDGDSAYHTYGIKEANPDFTKQDLYESIMKDGFFLNDQTMVEQFVEESPAIVYQVVQWALAAGNPFLFVPPAAWWMSGRMMGRALQYGLSTCPAIERIQDVAVLELLKDGDKVCGALAMELASGRILRIEAKAVVLGTGGFQPFSLKNTNSDMTGDGIAMAFRAGASLADMEFLLFLISALEPKDIVGSILPIMLVTNPNFVYVATDRNGVELTMPPELKELETKSEICKLLHLVYYGKAISGDGRTEKGGVYLKLVGSDEQIHKAFDETIDLFKKFYKEGFYHSDDINKVRRLCLETRRWEVALINEYSLGGILVDETMATAVQGLYAAGECASGVFGANRVADAVTEMVVQGNRAGISAAAFAASTSYLVPATAAGDGYIDYIAGALDRKEGALVNQLTSKFEEVSDRYLNCYRDKEGLEKAIQAYESIEAEVARARTLSKDTRYNAELISLFSLGNRLLCSKIAAIMAERREESRGLHLRKDFPLLDNEKHFVRTIATKVGNTIELTSRKPVPGKMPIPGSHTMPYEQYLLETGIGLENL